MKVAVIGGCASGKTTISMRLRELGFDAYVVGQEHSEISDLWKRRSPDRVVFLETTLEAVRARRGDFWPEWLFRRQYQRLKPARDAADVVVDTSGTPVEESLRVILSRIER